MRKLKKIDTFFSTEDAGNTVPDDIDPNRDDDDDDDEDGSDDGRSDNKRVWKSDNTNNLRNIYFHIFDKIICVGICIFKVNNKRFRWNLVSIDNKATQTMS